MDLIWNVSLICPWDCEFCCTDAVHVKKIAGSVVLRESGLSSKRIIPMGRHHPDHLRKLGIKLNAFDYALIDRQARGLELDFSSKLLVLNNLRGKSPEIDFAGGDPLACLENYLLIKKASEMFGKANISVTSTGHSLARYPLLELAQHIGTFEFTYDEPDSCGAEVRPKGYNAINVLWAARIRALGVRTKCQIPLQSNNISIERIREIYQRLADSRIDEILLMRTFPVGRGAKFLNEKSIEFDSHDYISAISEFRKLELDMGGPKVRVQCALKHLFSMERALNPCDLMQSSFGINSKGQLLLSAWATNEVGLPLAEEFVLGDLSNQSIGEIECSEKFVRYKARLDENFGHCKIFAYVNSDIKSENAIFMRNDPLFSNLHK